MDSKDLEQLKTDIQIIKDCLVGTMGQKGLARRVETLEEERSSDRAKMTAIMWLLPIGTAALSSLLLHKW